MDKSRQLYSIIPFTRRIFVKLLLEEILEAGILQLRDFCTDLELSRKFFHNPEYTRTYLYVPMIAYLPLFITVSKYGLCF